MKTRIDAAIAGFMPTLVEEDQLDVERLQQLLDHVRTQFDLDVVYVLERIGESYDFTYKFASVSQEKYDNRGVVISIPAEQYENALHMYDQSPVCGYNVDFDRSDRISDCIIHYGFVRKNTRNYDGSIGFQTFTPRIWSEEEKEALIKLGRLLKMLIGISLSERINEDLYGVREANRRKKSIIQALSNIYFASYYISLSDNTYLEEISIRRLQEYIPKSGDAQEAFRLWTEREVEESFLETVRTFIDLSTLPGRMAHTNILSQDCMIRQSGWIRVSFIAVDRNDEGSLEHVLWVAQHIDEERRKELSGQQALKEAYVAANKANAAKSNFLASMSHDIRTPMNAIIGMTAIAATHLEDRERVEDCLGKITVSSRHLLGLINEILDMSKIETGKLDMNEEEFLLPELIDNLLVMSKPQLAAKRHDLSVAIHGIDHEAVIGDSQRIQQVFMNLMGNAIKYTPEGGSIRLSITERPSNNRRAGCFEFIFEDNGIGMSEEFQAHLFEPFTRASDDRVAKIQGTGLGMSIAKSIVQMMNGNIQVTSRINEGTKVTATIFLRLQTTDNTVSYDDFLDLPILVADDDEVACMSTCEVLEELGMRGEYVLSGEEAVQRIAARCNSKDSFFAVILDWKMPDMDGIETTRAIRRQVGEDVPIIIISAYDWSDIELKARAAGANAFISKPLFKSRMVRVFMELMGREEANEAKTAKAGLSQFDGMDFSAKRALLVEDNELNAEIAKEVLGMTGMEVDLACDGKEALDCMTEAEDGYYDIVFMDIQMPVMNGYEATRAIRALNRGYTKRVPIIAMTANAFAEDVQAAKNSGMNEHIAKPIDFERLQEVLMRWL